MMTGIEKIKTEILEDAKKQAEEIKAEARQQAEAVKQQAQKEADAEYEELMAQAKNRADNVAAVGIPTAELEGKKALLMAKNTIIHKVINESLADILALPDEAYFDLISSLIEQHSKTGEKGELLFNKKDFERLPKLFSLKSSIKSFIEGKKLTVSKETRDIQGGFILRYGNIEENCSFEALFEERKEELFDLVNKLLFAAK